MQHGRMVVENYRFVLLSIHIDNFLALGDGGQRLIDYAQSFQSFSGSVQLSESAINQHQAGHSLIFFLDALVAARDYFAHGGEIVHAYNGADDELAVVGLLYLAFFPNYHRSYGFGALNMGDV